MKVLSLVICLFFGTVSAQCVETDTVNINKSYRILAEHPTDKTAQKLFFEAFPNSWPEFISTYKYSDSPGYNLSMYKLYQKHCDAFINYLYDIESIKFCQKLVELAIGARIDYDAPNTLRSMQHTAMQKRREDMISAIRTLLISDRLLYWQFYWSSTLKNDDEANEFIELYTLLNEKGLTDDANIMKMAFDYFHGKASTISSKHVGQSSYESKDY